MSRLLALVSILLLALPALAWDATGHSIIAVIAYDRLTGKTRARVDQLIREHPDYETILTRGAPDAPEARARYAFMTAAVWPDMIKGDRRFWDDTRQNAVPTALLPGFPDMRRHTNWHYYDTPYAPDGAPIQMQPPPSALSELPRLIRELNRASELQKVYDLPWFEHIEGDVHQPLHSIGRFLRSAEGSDQGGNRVFVMPGQTLHAFWDSACGRENSLAYITKFAAEAVAENPAPRRMEKNPRKWIEESAKIAIAQVYTFGNETGSREQPLRLPQSYVENARRVAKARVALAGYRLAAMLNDRLK
ncbi:MAG TPA: S1/P1 nuclease [Bryobacteraceae bacterium]|nr:S1/P1 nuclease [Bryobacteraceae bacterium]